MIFYNEVAEIYRRAFDTYGRLAQMLVCMEEMAELQKELCKNTRGADNVEHIAEELADVQIMTEQMSLLFGCEGLAANYRQMKLERLRARLEETENEF